MLKERKQEAPRAEVHGEPLAAPLITITDFRDDHLTELEVTNPEELITYRDQQNPTWIDVSGDHSFTTLQRITEIFHLHPLTLEDIVSLDQRPKLEEFENYMFIVLQIPNFLTHIKVEQVSLALTPTVVLSFHERPPGRFAPIRGKVQQERKRILRLGTDYLAYVIMDAIVDGYFLTLERFEERLQELDRAILQSHSSNTPIESVHAMRQELMVMRRTCWPLREVISALRLTSSPLFDEQIKVYLKDLQDHIVQTVEVIEVYRDTVRGMLDIYLSTMSHHMNQVMKTLTMIAAIFIPLTLITGIYGMNFQHMPELNWVFGYPAVLSAMVLVGLGMFLWFKRKGWV
ncbi:MAG: magnesium/cobalt transporter CorA [Verrucomicrobia bacterium]|nr:magnesium/cobalt transporter CorA [Verrucomicrobiota bacterium]